MARDARVVAVYDAIKDARAGDPNAVFRALLLVEDLLASIEDALQIPAQAGRRAWEPGSEREIPR